MVGHHHKTNRMQSSNDLRNSRVVGLDVIYLVRHWRVQHTKQSIRNLPSLRWRAAITGWPEDKNCTDNDGQENDAATNQKKFAD